MRVSELEAREDHANIMVVTLTGAIEQHFGVPVSVSEEPTLGAQPWYLQRLLSVYFSGPLNRRVRRFLADSFRYTDVPWRAAAQWMFGTVLASKAGLALSAPPTFWVSPPVPAEDFLVIPGNRRIRLLDFGSKTATAWLKAGYASKDLRNEIQVRRLGVAGPFPTVFDVDVDGRWFKERLIDGRPLARYSSKATRRKKEVEALSALHEWLDAFRTETISADSYVRSLHDRVRRKVFDLTVRYGGAPIITLDELAELREGAAKVGKLRLSRTHGDFQPGNILIEKSTENVFIIDWEYSSTRSFYYDYMVYGLMARSSAGLAERLSHFISSATLPGLPVGLATTPNLRPTKALAALFCLEDLDRVLDESLSGPFKRVPPRTHELAREITLFAADCL